MPFADVYPAYVNKVERKNRSVGELHEVISWLTGYNEKKLQQLIKTGGVLWGGKNQSTCFAHYGLYLWSEDSRDRRSFDA